ncbi:MAG: diguanylate cyclase [Zhongshania sp.]|uniref:diguanylate cyclase domain-containing protein n=1 Tax=Zhongshania sp. TaxID=1971902 RepID=UPI0026271F60|nr:diguanylate cyclase [Zhongshania sp.]MDF1691374.1 diguanylate cyclase [Zhongshania sp.]
MPNASGISDYKLHRNRFVVRVLWATLFYITTVVLASQFWEHIEIESRNLLSEFSLFAIGGIIVSLFTIRLANRLFLAVNIFITTLSCGLLYVVLNTGGIYSPITPCIVIIPALATLSIGAVAGVIWSAIVFIASLCLYLAAQKGVVVMNVVAPQTQILAEFVGIFTATAFTIFITVHYDLSTRKLRKLVDAEHRNVVHLAHHDSLTDLANRRHFIKEIERAIFNAKLNDSVFCVLYFDLNDFKKINDTLGHHCGDIILVKFGRRLRSQSRGSDIVARLGGDEFCMLLPGLGDSEIIQKKIYSYSKALAEPIQLENLSYQISVSIGYAVYPRHGEDYESLLKVADQRMYEVKRGNTGKIPSAV